MYGFLIAIFVVVCFLMTFVILIQSSKGGGLAGTFGGSSNSMGTLFGGRGSAPFLTKLTGILATVFLVISLIMGMITHGNVDQASLVEKERERMMSSPARTLPQVPQQDNAGQSAAPETPAPVPAQ